MLNKKKWTITAIFIFTILTAGGSILHKNNIYAVLNHPEMNRNVQSAEKSENIYLVRTITIGKSDIESNYIYSGEVRGRYETQLGFQVGGKILKRNVELGSSVKQGDILMAIDEKDLAQSFKNCEAQVFAAKSQLKLAETNYNRYGELLKKGAICQADFDRAQTTFDAARAALRQAQALYTQQSNLMEYTLLKADTAGIISSIDAEIGQVIGAGQKVLTLVRNEEKEIEINIPENRIENLRSASSITATFWALPGISVNGKIREISPVADSVSRTYKVRISLLKAPAEIKFGMTSSVAIKNAGNEQSIIKLPLSAIYQTASEPMVWTVSNGTVNLRQIKINSFGEDGVIVTDGLKAGDIVVTAGVHKLWKGQKVRTEGESL
ncbi:MAG: efflux RND transporter periplasmic adaptor subunit [Candidatus Wallbacteria bacterium]